MKRIIEAIGGLTMLTFMLGREAYLRARYGPQEEEW